MQRRFCEEGLRLDANYFEKIRAWISAEADKRVAVGAPNGVGATEWNQIARRVDEAKLGHELALSEYLSHMINCPVCTAHLPSLAEHASHHAR